MDATNAGKEETPCNDFDETLDLEKRLSKQFEEVLKLIQEDAFWNNVGEGIEKTYPEIKKLLKERMKDLEKRDCEIVVAGIRGKNNCGLCPCAYGMESRFRFK
uniref:Uncharacterized protein n=1 Tax=Magallana gigas TaxID=29159 RepID=K1Q7T8_MAGGI